MLTNSVGSSSEVGRLIHLPMWHSPVARTYMIALHDEVSATGVFNKAHSVARLVAHLVAQATAQVSMVGDWRPAVQDSWEMEVPTNLVLKSSLRIIVDLGGLAFGLAGVHERPKLCCTRSRRTIRLRMLRPSETT